MKLFMHWDMEGASGLFSREQTWFWEPGVREPIAAEGRALLMAVGDKLFRDIRDTAAEQSVCDSETCRWQIEHGTGAPSLHPIEILLMAYEGASSPQTIE